MRWVGWSMVLVLGVGCHRENPDYGASGASSTAASSADASDDGSEPTMEGSADGTTGSATGSGEEGPDCVPMAIERPPARDNFLMTAEEGCNGVPCVTANFGDSREGVIQDAPMVRRSYLLLSFDLSDIRMLAPDSEVVLMQGIASPEESFDLEVWPVPAGMWNEGKGNGGPAEPEESSWNWARNPTYWVPETQGTFESILAESTPLSQAFEPFDQPQRVPFPLPPMLLELAIEGPGFLHLAITAPVHEIQAFSREHQDFPPRLHFMGCASP